MSTKPIFEVVSQISLVSEYINQLNLHRGKSLRELLSIAHTVCNGLPSEADLQTTLCKNSNGKDKGLTGKVIEYGFFGNRPNSSPLPDLPCGLDIKSCAFITNKKGGLNAKERSTLTNCGTTSNYESFRELVDNPAFQDCKFYEKSKQFILVVRQDDGIKNRTWEQVMEQKIILFLIFDIENLPLPIRDIIDIDYAKIRQCIIDNKVSQKGQQYLHIHPHGAGHGSGNRALGYTNRFITTIVGFKIAELSGKQLSE